MTTTPRQMGEYIEPPRQPTLAELDESDARLELLEQPTMQKLAAALDEERALRPALAAAKERWNRAFALGDRVRGFEPTQWFILPNARSAAANAVAGEELQRQFAMRSAVRQTISEARLLLHEISIQRHSNEKTRRRLLAGRALLDGTSTEAASPVWDRGQLAKALAEIPRGPGRIQVDRGDGKLFKFTTPDDPDPEAFNAKRFITENPGAHVVPSPSLVPVYTPSPQEMAASAVVAGP